MIAKVVAMVSTVEFRDVTNSFSMKAFSSSKSMYCSILQPAFQPWMRFFAPLFKWPHASVDVDMLKMLSDERRGARVH